AALVMNLITRPDRRDYFALPFDPRDYTRDLQRPMRGTRLAAMRSVGCGASLASHVETAFVSACRRFDALGAEVEELAPPFEHHQVFDEVAPALLPAYAQRFIDVTAGHTERLTQTSQNVLAYALRLTVADIVTANRALGRTIACLMSLFERYDYIISPTLA